LLQPLIQYIDKNLTENDQAADMLMILRFSVYGGGM